MKATHRRAQTLFREIKVTQCVTHEHIELAIATLLLYQEKVTVKSVDEKIKDEFYYHGSCWMETTIDDAWEYLEEARELARKLYASFYDVRNFKLNELGV